MLYDTSMHSLSVLIACHLSLSLSLCVCVHVCAYLLEYDNALPEEPLCDFGRDEEVSLGRVQQMQLDIPKGEERVIEVHAELLCACIFHAHASPSSRSFVEAHHSQPARRASSLLDSVEGSDLRNPNMRIPRTKPRRGDERNYEVPRPRSA